MKLKTLMTSGLALLLPCLATAALAASPYTGQETREIKALSDSDVAGLLSGEGMGYAIAAELNGYPGPAHVLELADELALTSAQRTETEAIFEQMRESAKALGSQLVAAERELNQKFDDKSIDETSLSGLVARIGRLQSDLRIVHLNAHLQQTRLLDQHQIARYRVLRGYDGGGHGDHHRHHHHGG